MKEKTRMEMANEQNINDSLTPNVVELYTCRCV